MIPEHWPDTDKPEVGWLVQRAESGEYRLQFADPDIPVSIYGPSCTRRSGHEDYQLADNSWRVTRAEWWRTHAGTYNGFDLPEPDPTDFGAYGWGPGPRGTELLAQAESQLGKAQERHRLYEAAIAAPLIVLAGLR